MKTVARALILLPIVLLAGHWTLDFFTVDSCLDAGGVYDYSGGLCRHDIDRLPYVSYLERDWHWLAGVAVSVLVGAIALAKSHGTTSER